MNAFCQIKNWLKTLFKQGNNYTNPRIKMLKTLQAHYEDRKEDGLTLTNKIRLSVGLPPTKQIPLTDDEYQKIMSTIDLTMDKIKD